MNYNELRINLHKRGFYTEEKLSSIGAAVIDSIPCDGSYQISAASSQIILKLNTTKPSELDLSNTIFNALAVAIAEYGYEISPSANLFNILISHVGGKYSTIIIML